MSEFVCGLDLGQVNDYTALAIVEVMPTGILHLRHIQRFRLGVKYTTITAQVERILGKLPGSWVLVIDGTGVGRGILDMFNERDVSFVPVSITGGNEAKYIDREWKLPKRDLVTALTVSLQNKKLMIARGLQEKNALVNEMLNFKIKISTTGHDSYNAWRSDDHDDLVLALSLAVWYANKTAGSLGIDSLICGGFFGHVQIDYGEAPDYQHMKIDDFEDLVRRE